MIFETENWIVKERQDRSLSQYKLAKLLKIPNTKLCSWEKGKSLPTITEENKIKKMFSQFDKHFEEGKIDLKKKYRGRAKNNKQPSSFTEDNSDDCIARYPKGFLNNRSVTYSAELNRKPTAIALFAGCGGMSLGFKWAGFDVKGFVEIEKSARDIYKANFKNAEELGTDILNLSDEEIRSWKNRLGEIEVICGGPPCQGFSLAGKRNEADYRNKLYKEYQRIAEIIRPKVFILENVKLLTSMKDEDGNRVVDNIVKGFERIGYDTTFKVVSAAEYGVPQGRQRVIFIGVDKRLGLAPTLPEETHEIGPVSLLGRKKARTFKDACGDLRKLEAGGKCNKDPLHWAIDHPPHVLEWLRVTPEGKSAHENEDPKMRPPSGYNTTYKRIRWDEPCSTVSTNFNMISGSRNVHPTSTRSFTIREAMRCQTFPDDFKVVGNWMKVRTAIGNAVPPLLAEQIAVHIRENFIR